MQPAIFLDRDGVIIQNRPNYVRSWEDVDIFPQALRAISKLRDLPYKVVIVTNQSAVGRGIITLEDAERINRLLVNEISGAGGQIDGIYMCPHAPEEGCDCRKPNPGLILEASEAQSLDLKRSVLIGDALSDLVAGRAAGISRVALVLTGRGGDQVQTGEAESLKPFMIYANLEDAIDSIINLSPS
jgi:D-glycero-D-manno-heptose 1,7-bisphosphate phosphatase